MKQKLKISVSKEPQPDSTISCKRVSLRERLLTMLFGQKQEVMVLVPGNNVSEVTISEIHGGDSVG